MFEKSSFYTVNKYDKDAIVCPNINGDPVRLTREFFQSEEEFLYWKTVSDEDYHLRDNADVDEERHTVPLYHEDEKIGAVIGPEEEMIAQIERIERGKASAPQAFIDKVASVLGVENIEDYVSEVANPNLKKKMAKRAEKTEEKQPAPADEVGKASAVSQEQSIVSDFLELLKKKEEKIEMLEAEIEELKQELAVYRQATCK